MNHPSQTKLSIESKKEPLQDFVLYEEIIKDRGSRYSVAGGSVQSRKDAKAFLKRLKSDKRYAQATHNSWAAIINNDGQIWETKNDDGEAGAGMVILRQLQKSDYHNIIVVVTRWFGGEKLHGDRFRHLVEATKYFLEKI